MDTSKEYINMAEKAVEIRKNHILDDNDYFYNREFKKVFTCCLICDSEYGGEDNYKYSIWLPRQDQLQGMLEMGILDLISAFDDWCLNMMSFKWVDGNSMEQLWLAFVMRERFNKIWTGQDWRLSDG